MIRLLLWPSSNNSFFMYPIFLASQVSYLFKTILPSNAFKSLFNIQSISFFNILSNNSKVVD